MTTTKFPPLYFEGHMHFCSGHCAPLPLLWPPASRWPWRSLYELARAGALAWPGLLAFQFVAECAPVELAKA